MRRFSKIHHEEAQGLIEFALIGTVLLYLLLGTVDFGRFLYYDTAIRSAAETGAMVASNHCAYADYACGTTTSGSAVSDNFVMWSTYCEAAPSVNLNLGQYLVGQPNTLSTGTSAYTPNGSIGACAANDSSATWTPTCASSATCTPCANDICVSPASRNLGSPVSVSVGYDFQPIAPLVSVFFQPRQCWPNDPSTNNHTLCATAVGQVDAK